MFLVKAKESLDISGRYGFIRYLTKDRIYLCVEIIHDNTCYRIEKDDRKKTQVHCKSHFTGVTFVDIWELKRNEKI